MRPSSLGLHLVLVTFVLSMQALAEPPLPLKVEGTHVVNSKGDPVLLRGVNAASLEWTSDGEGHILTTVKTAIRDWHVNHVRIPLSQDRWFGKGPEQNGDSASYRALVKEVADLCAREGCYVILDLHWSDAGEWGKNIGQHKMPDENSLAFWKDFAPVYKNQPAVIFDLYNEPFRVSWDVWLKGGKVSETEEKTKKALTYEAVGMQALLDAVRATGAKNVVIVGGLDWSYDLSGILDGRQLADLDGNGVIYANHAYPFKGDTVEQWVEKMEKAAKTLPLIISEFGSDAAGSPRRSGEQWVRKRLRAMQEHSWAWTAWDLHPAAGPTLISDWSYTPTPHFGVLVKQALVGRLSADPPDPETLALGLFESHADVGTVLHPGTSTLDAARGVYMLSAGGENMWFAKDAFQFAWKKMTGDVSLTAEIAFPMPGKNPHRKACLMIRQSLNDNSPYADVAVHGEGLTSLQFRAAKGDATHEIQSNISAPGKVRIEKRNGYVMLYVGEKGGDVKYSGAAVRIAFEEPFYVGLGLCAHDKDVVEKAEFSKVELTTHLSDGSKSPTLYSTLETQLLSSTDRRVVLVTPTRIEAPNWLKDGTTLIYNSGGRIYRIPIVGGSPARVDTGFATRCNNDHGVSPDGKMLAISDQSQGRQSMIYTVPLDGGTPTQVTQKGPSYWHGWSPDGKTLAYCAQRDDEFDIYTIPVNGGEETRLTTAKGLDDGPEYSPDGQHIYFNSVRSGLMQIWRMKPDGSDQEQVTRDAFNNWFAHPSPDGQSIVFLSYDKQVTGHPENKDVTLRQLTLEDRQVRPLARLFGGQGTINVPCWSPDGRRIAFVTYQMIP